MGQKRITITIRVSLPEDATFEDQKILVDIAEDAIDDALERAGFDGAVIESEHEATASAEGLPIESMPTIADLLDDEDD